jgi:hypothetical protein
LLILMLGGSSWTTVPISPFNLQSNVVTSISSLLLVQIWYFFLFFFLKSPSIH